MPQGKGTYGNQVGRPSKNKSMANGDPKKKVKSAGKFQSKEEAIKNIKAFGKGEGRGRGGAILSGEKSAKEKYKEAGKKVDMVKNVAKNPYPKPADTAIDKARKASGRNMSGPAPQRGPRSEGKRGRGTGWAN